jgi:hypothetical protein
MNWEAIGAIGEIIGALAVVLSLIYLATQIKHSSKVAQSSTRHEVTKSVMIGGQMLAENDQLAFLMQKMNSGENLEPHERLRLNALAYTTTRNWENIHYQYLNGMLTENEWRAFRANLKALFQVELWKD